jgi:hypothetical protein
LRLKDTVITCHEHPYSSYSRSISTFRCPLVQTANRTECVYVMFLVCSNQKRCACSVVKVMSLPQARNSRNVSSCSGYSWVILWCMMCECNDLLHQIKAFSNNNPYSLHIIYLLCNLNPRGSFVSGSLHI